MDNKAVGALSLKGEALLTCETSHGLELRASLVRLSRHEAVFEVYHSHLGLRSSEVLGNCKILLGDTPVFAGRAVVRSLINTGALYICEAELGEGWLDFDVGSLGMGVQDLSVRYREFLQDWQASYRVIEEFKLWVADVHSFLMDLRLWCDQIELGVRSTPAGDRIELERDVVRAIAPELIGTLNTLFERFEPIASRIEEPLQPAHHSYIKRHLHPLVLCSPFAYRTFHKPLGYAGDYEMVNMILREPGEGSSLFAKLLNCWFISQPPAEAHRNRIDYLVGRIKDETLRVRQMGRAASIFNLGCGPAGEVQRFMAESALANDANFLLLDFNDETLHFADTELKAAKRQHGRRTGLQLSKRSVMQILKSGSRSSPAVHDLVYCAGLFDYLPDRLCKELMNIFYDMLAPGGLLVATNVDCSNPIRNMLDYLLEWHLIYRNGQQMLKSVPDRAPKDCVAVFADVTSVNIFLEVRKPKI